MPQHAITAPFLCAREPQRPSPSLASVPLHQFGRSEKQAGRQMTPRIAAWNGSTAVLIALIAVCYFGTSPGLLTQLELNTHHNYVSEFQIYRVSSFISRVVPKYAITLSSCHIFSTRHGLFYASHTHTAACAHAASACSSSSSAVVAVDSFCAPLVDYAVANATQIGCPLALARSKLVQYGISDSPRVDAALLSLNNCLQKIKQTNSH